MREMKIISYKDYRINGAIDNEYIWVICDGCDKLVHKLVKTTDILNVFLDDYYLDYLTKMLVLCA
jgi:hypothetical protein